MADGDFLQALSPSPAEAEELWNSIDIGSIHFPALPGEGCVKVRVKTGRDVDQQKANGKNGARTKVKGRKVSKVSLTFQFNRVIWAESNALRIALDPNVDELNEPLEVGHPECSDRRVNRLLPTDMGELNITGDLYSFTVECDGWNEPGAAQLGGTTMPTKAKKVDPAGAVAANGDTTFTTSDGNTIDLGGGDVAVITSDGNGYGFDGDDAPKADP